MVTKKKILFLDILTNDPGLRKKAEEEFGAPYPAETRRALGLSEKQFLSVDGAKGRFPNLENFDAVIIGGSAVDPVPGREKLWMKKAYKFIREIIKAQKPLLGICGGLEFTVRALGGNIIYNSRGRNFGTTLVSLTPTGRKDNLFKGLPRTIKVQSNHRCIVPALKTGWKTLAFSKMTPFEAIAIGKKIRLVQFHPERTLRNMRVIAEPFKRKLLSNTSKTGRKIMRNFLRHFVLP